MIYTRINPSHKKRHHSIFPSIENIFNEMMRTNLNDIIEGDKNKLSYSTPGVNSHELSDSFVLEMAIPGIAKKDIKIDIDKDRVTISSDLSEENTEAYKLREFNFHKFKRSFVIPDTVDKSKISAKLKLGVLKIEMMKRAEDIDHGPQEINID